MEVVIRQVVSPGGSRNVKRGGEPLGGASSENGNTLIDLLAQ